MSEVVLFKFVSGEEIIAKQISVGDGATVVEDAVTLVYHRTEQGNVSVGFSPFMPYSDGPITLWHTSIGSVSGVKAELLAEYNRIFSNIEIYTQGAV